MHEHLLEGGPRAASLHDESEAVVYLDVPLTEADEVHAFVDANDWQLRFLSNWV